MTVRRGLLPARRLLYNGKGSERGTRRKDAPSVMKESTGRNSVKRQAGRGIFIFALALVLAAAGMTAGARGQSPPSVRIEDTGKAADISQRERIGFAFHKLVGLTPGFETWAMNTTGYRETQRELRQAFVQEESGRLRKAWEGYDVRQEMLRFLVPAKIKFPGKPDRDQLKVEGQDIPVQVELKNFEDGFFPFLIGESWIAVIPADYGEVSAFSLTDSDFAILTGNLGMDPYVMQWDVRAEILVKPVKASLENPIQRKGKNLWPMIGEVASIRIWQSYANKVVWKVYQAPWYKSADGDDLMDLYRR